MAHEGTHHAGHHEVSVWGLPTGLSVLFLSVAFMAYFDWKIPLLAVLSGGLGLALLAIGAAGWANEHFSKGRDEGHGFQGLVYFVFAEIIIFGSLFAAFWAARGEYREKVGRCGPKGW